MVNSNDKQPDKNSELTIPKSDIQEVIKVLQKIESGIIPQKYLDNIVKMQQDQDKARQEEFSILREYLGQTNILINRLTRAAITGTNIAEGKKSIPFHTGPVSVNTVTLTKPSDPDDYTEQVNVYALNDSRPVQHMTLVNDGPGDIYFIMAYARNEFSIEEGLLHPNDQRELFNVYEVRLRVTLPLTSYRLLEGIFRTGSFAPATKANVEIRPTVQPNEILIEFDALFDNAIPTILITSPTTQTLTPNYIMSPFQSPFPPGAIATLVNTATGDIMPYTIPEGCIIEFFSIFGNLSTDNTVRFYIELIPGEFSLFTTLPSSNRGVTFNLVLNVSNFTTIVVDRTGAPAGGRRVLATITNDDPFNNMIGDYNILGI